MSALINSTPVNFDTTPAHIDSVAVNCATAATNIGSELAALRSYVVELGAQWLGPTSLAFTDLMANYDRLTRDLVSALNDISVGLHHNAENYRVNEHMGNQQIISLNPGR
jgi:WXG100 family type VII secretion target